jgi:antitoxin (DNA-binding transcriptional repressor) of toxin-antitoxin stability system
MYTMKSANIGTLRNHLSRYLALVRRGETIEILDRKIPIARLTPIQPSTKAAPGTLSPWIQQLAREGRIRLGTGKLDGELLKPPPGNLAAKVLEALLEERKTGR